MAESGLSGLGLPPGKADTHRAAGHLARRSGISEAWHKPQKTLSPSERLTSRFIAEGEIHSRELD